MRLQLRAETNVKSIFGECTVACAWPGAGHRREPRSCTYPKALLTFVKQSQRGWPHLYIAFGALLPSPCKRLPRHVEPAQELATPDALFHHASRLNGDAAPLSGNWY
ncbi:unnamed protein product [Chondrus crispus]|uniref:Uncharacterized protein n=1 Tax=Chondrus crispus TaxID=2769 RepID=R7Q4T7_CHOCR|nr:unnamed protein product [Chondrus crispus]CDF33547.1 unnamed protein product [Chondrus crispus]|eukprot:XP_005713350.1 unnamed protein product [Chondrus crispus]